MAYIKKGLLAPKPAAVAAIFALMALLVSGCAPLFGGVQESMADRTQKEETEMSDTKMLDDQTKAVETGARAYIPLNHDDFKAMWLSQFDMQKIYLVGGAQRAEESFKSYAREIMANIKSVGINTVIIQVRPYADSMYPSEYYPMSSVAVGKYGAGASYDPFSILLASAHAEGLSVQAWINPMRAMLEGEIGSVGDVYPIKQWYDDRELKGKYIVNVSGRWYLNPAYEEVRALIIDGAREILEKYEVDGLHIDDYFYPTGVGASFDSAAYGDYIREGGRAELADWRRERLNELVSGLYSAVKEKDADLLFGISPAGNFKTTYESMYADIYEWCGKGGYIDYICPQAYFGFEHATYDFVKVVTAYQSMIKAEGVNLIVGMSLGKAYGGYDGNIDQYAGSEVGKNEWIKNLDILYRELEYTKTLDKCRGVAYFCYQYFFDPVSGAEINKTADERALFVPLLGEISWGGGE